MIPWWVPLNFVSARQRNWRTKTIFVLQLGYLSWASSESLYVANIIQGHSEVHIDFDYTFYLNQKSCFTFELARFQSELVWLWSKDDQKGSKPIISQNRPKSIKIQDIAIIIQNHRFLGLVWKRSRSVLSDPVHIPRPPRAVFVYQTDVLHPQLHPLTLVKRWSKGNQSQSSVKVAPNP